MLSSQECFDYCDLTEDEIHAIAEHEHVPEIIAAELGDCLLHSAQGAGLIRRFIEEAAQTAETQGHYLKARRLHQVLARFVETHPDPLSH